MKSHEDNFNLAIVKPMPHATHVMVAWFSCGVSGPAARSATSA
jgi:hypothetical protein